MHSTKFGMGLQFETFARNSTSRIMTASQKKKKKTHLNCWIQLDLKSPPIPAVILWG